MGAGWPRYNSLPATMSAIAPPQIAFFVNQYSMAVRLEKGCYDRKRPCFHVFVLVYEELSKCEIRVAIDDIFQDTGPGSISKPTMNARKS